MSIVPALRPIFTALGLSALSFLSAQVNPKWQTTASPDFLDLYQQSSNTKLKPEVVTVFDFTGSMDTLMYHGAFNNNDTDDNDGGSNLKFTVTNNSGVYTCAVSMTVPAGYYPNTGGTYYASFTLSNGQPIRPDGTVITGATINANYVGTGLPGESASPKAADARNWIRSCSHVRFTYNSRTLDLPVPWTILDDLSVQPNSTEKRKMYDTYPLKMTIADPVSGTEVEMDTAYRVSNNNIPNTAGTQSSITMSGSTAWYRTSYMHWLWRYTPQPVPNSSATVFGFRQGIPARTRASAVKDAALRTWVSYSNKVFWAYRFINNDSSYAVLENSKGTILNNDSRNLVPGDPTTAELTGGVQRGWFLLNKDSLTGMRRLAGYVASGGTMLTYALGNTLAQLNDPNNIFNDVQTNTNTVPFGDPAYDASKDNAPKECMKHFVILFTDGQPNSDGGGENMNTPYIDGTGVGSAETGNAVIAGNKTTMNPNSTYWNIMNLSAVAAHGGDQTLANFMVPGSYPTTTNTWPNAGSMSSAAWVPYSIKQRGSLVFNKPHSVQIMTVGVSLSGLATDATSPKRRMFLAAAFGDPAMKTWKLADLKPFQLLDPSNPDSPKDPNAVYFFDASDPGTLVTYLEKAFAAAAAISNVNSTAAPVFPFLGAGLGHQVYLAQFKPPQEGGPIWKGDLMMFPTLESNGETKILDATGNPITTALDLATPQWSAAKILKTRGWQNRIVYTRVQATSANPNPPIVRLKDSGSEFTYLQGTPLYKTDGTVDSSRTSILPGSGTTQVQTVQWMLGADITGTTTPLPTRADIMGDVIDSSPAVIEYSTLDTSKLPPGSQLGAYWQAGRHFRVVFVGTNQGHLHAFGEVSWEEEATNAQGNKVKVTKGVADELWSFVPTDVLPYIDYYRNQGNTHRFAVNGQPTAYLLDLPADGAISGNGMMDVTNANERAYIIFGLGRGGRSYYGINVSDPFNPKLGVNAGSGGWALCPDEPASYGSTRFEGSGGSSATIAKMGYSTSLPAIGRVFYNDGMNVDMNAYPSGKGKVRDAVFLGGGYSLPELETKNGGTQLGRSILALDVNTGKILRTWDLSASGAGPVSAGAVPTSVFPNTGLVHRAYAADLYGNLFVVGSNETIQTGSTQGFRVDRHQLDNWATRTIFKNTLGTASNGIVSTLPSTFLVGSFFTRNSTPYIAPLTIGIAMETGDRNNPVDTGYSSTNTTPIYKAKPTQHRLLMFYDRQDSGLLNLDTNGITESNLYDMTSQTTPFAPIISPGNSQFYIKQGYHGYYINFKTRASGEPYVTKGITSPLVLSGVLYYSAFSPSSYDVCTGGQGQTTTTRICDALKPVVSGTVNGCTSGDAAIWTGVASRLAAKSVVAALQAGTVPSTGGGGGGSQPTDSALQVRTFGGNITERFAKPRTWRTVH